jgi:hypothetical protein
MPPDRLRTAGPEAALDRRDSLTRQLFDEASVTVLDRTGGAFTAWFEGDLARIVRLSGAPSHSTLRIEWIEQGFRLAAQGPHIEGEMVRLILQHADHALPTLFIYNNAFVLAPHLRRRKVGVRSLAIELIEARKTGQFAYVEVEALGNVTTLNPRDPAHQYSGYAVWPQLGFDGEIPAALRDRTPELQGWRTVGEVLASPGGLAVWLRHGDSCRLRFDLSDGSRSWIVLQGYLRDNRIEVQR